MANIDLNQVSGIDTDKTQLISIDGETTRSLNVFFKNFFKVLDKLKWIYYTKIVDKKLAKS